MKRFIAVFAWFLAIIFTQTSAQTVFSLSKPDDWNNWPKQFQFDMEGIVKKVFYEFKADVKITLTGDGKIDKLITCRFPQKDNYEQIDQTKWSFVDSVKVVDKSGDYRFRAQTESWSAADTTKQFFSDTNKRILWENFVLFKEVPTKGKFRLEFTNVKITDGAGAKLSANESFFYEIDFGPIDTVVTPPDTVVVPPDTVKTVIDSVALEIKTLNKVFDFSEASQNKYGKAEFDLWLVAKDSVEVDSLSFVITVNPEIKVSALSPVTALKFYLDKVDSGMVGDRYRLKIVGKLPADTQKLANINLLFTDLRDRAVEFQLDSIKIWISDQQLAKNNFASLLLNGSEVYKAGIFKKGDVNEQFGDTVIDEKDLEFFTNYFSGNFSGTLSYYKMWALDYNGDGLITKTDYNLFKELFPPSSVEPAIVTLTQVYPNPIIDNFTISLADELADNAELTVTDINGRVMPVTYQSGAVIVVQLKVEPGCYWLTVKNKGKIFTGKIIKN